MTWGRVGEIGEEKPCSATGFLASYVRREHLLSTDSMFLGWVEGRVNITHGKH